MIKIMNNRYYKPHIFSLCALFVVGNAVIMLPFFFADSPFLSFAATAVFSLLFVWIVTVVIKFASKNKTAFFVIKAIIYASAIYGAVTSLYDFICFVSQIQLPQTNAAFITVVSIITICVFALCDDSAFFKYGLTVAVISGLCVLLMFIGGIKHFDFSQLGLSVGKHIVCTDVVKIFFRYFSSLVSPVAFVILNNKITDTKAAFGGIAAGFSVVGLCLVQSVSTLGHTNLSFPYIKAIGVISSGSLFSRIDGLAYFLFFATAMTKAALCVKTVVLIRRYKHFVAKK